MKKIFTLVMLSILTVMNVNAEETTLWEGEYAIDWSSAWEPNNLATPILTKEEFANYEIGQKINFYFTTPKVEGYYLVRFTTWKQQEKGLGLDDFSVTYKETGTTKITIEVTEDLKEKVAGTAEDGGFVVSGHAVSIVKVSLGEDSSEETTMWEGEYAIDWSSAWEPNNLATPILTKEEFANYEIGQKINFYFTTPKVEGYYLVRFTTWKQQEKGLGLDDFSVTYKETGTTKITIEVTEDLKEKVAGTAEDGGFVVSGHGVSIVKVTKDVITPTGINTVAAAQKNDNRYYNLRGQVVTQPTKGLYIINGKKVLFK